MDWDRIRGMGNLGGRIRISPEGQGQRQEQPGVQDDDETERGYEPPVDADLDGFTPKMKHIGVAMKFIDMLKDATLGSELEPLSPELIERLQNPPEGPVEFTKDEEYSLKTYLASDTLSERTYARVTQAAKERFDESDCNCNSDFKPLSFHNVKKLIMEVSGCYPIVHHMCIKSCVAFTGAYAEMQKCPECMQKDMIW